MDSEEEKKAIEKIKKWIRKKHCPSCGGQRCYGQDDWIEGCEYYQKARGIKTQAEILADIMEYGYEKEGL